MIWTHFYDMASGGGRKLQWQHIFIEAPLNQAKSVFYSRLGRNPDRVTCTCCGSDYSTDEDSLEELTEYWRGDKSFEDFLQQDDVLVIPTTEIKPEEPIVEVPEEGYVWK